MKSSDLVPSTGATYTQAQVIALAVALVGCLVSVLAIAQIMPGDPWASFKQATCVSDETCFCEADRHATIRQPADTWSNLGFAILGAAVLADPRRPANPPAGAAAWTIYIVLAGVSAIVLGVMSGYYHLSLTFVGQWFDNEGMFLVTGASIAYNCARLGAPKFVVPVYAVIALGCGAAAWFLPVTRRYVFAGTVVALLATTLVASARIGGRATRKSAWLWAATGTLVLSFGIWNIDLHDVFGLCHPYSLIQGHAIWHMLDALSFYFLFLFMRSETYNEP